MQDSITDLYLLSEMKNSHESEARVTLRYKGEDLQMQVQYGTGSELLGSMTSRYKQLKHSFILTLLIDFK